MKGKVTMVIMGLANDEIGCAIIPKSQWDKPPYAWRRRNTG